MPVPVDTLEALLRDAFPTARIHINDLVGDADHYKVEIFSDDFLGKTKIQQHQMVYKALKAIIGKELHAMTLTTGVLS